ncbi:hypothetical protein [Polyangium sp. y55x31]|uniref:TolB family protein n=1 Tax=Polyangium sp. y55x31 TaxID=3042688 RepID=UPI00248211C7|nr:hypothetical protein [Polyangium sp. y55x31]MDI1475371.1 hypothetical protein [Polyangium sp. y55x31]
MLRGNQRYALGIIAALAGCTAIAPSTSSSSEDTRTAPIALGTDTPVGFSTSPLPIPAGIDRLLGGFWLDNGEILTSGRYQGQTSAVVGVMDAQGTSFRCISCGLVDAVDLGRPQPFADGKRILVQSPSSSNVLEDFTHWILTCAPSIADCQAVTAEPLRGMKGGPRSLQERWPSISPDGQHIAWTRVSAAGYRMLFADLVHTAAGYEVTGIRVLNPAHDLGTLEGLLNATAWYEIKGFTEDGGGLLVGSTRGGTMNLDGFVLHLATGAWERLTTDPDWDEDHEISPDGSWFVVGSARGEETLTPFSLIPLPPLIDFGIVAPITYYHIGGDARRSGRRHVWRFPRQSDAESGGQWLVPAPGTGEVLSTGPELSADGHSMLFGARMPGAADRELLVGHFDEPVHAAVSWQPTPTPPWAPLLSDAPALPATFLATIDGPQGGHARVHWIGGTAGGSFSVEYQGYTSGEGLVIDGAQRYEGAPVLGRYRADVTVSGAAQGSASADLWIVNSDRCGSVSATLGGRSVGQQYDCDLPDLP